MPDENDAVAMRPTISTCSTGRTTWFTDIDLDEGSAGAGEAGDPDEYVEEFFHDLVENVSELIHLRRTCQQVSWTRKRGATGSGPMNYYMPSEPARFSWPCVVASGRTS